MSKNLLDRVSIANPCTTDWGLMMGDERKRYCQQCDKHVYNLSQMTRQQAEALLRQTNGKLCARFERRPDGSILTTDKSFSLPRFNTKFLRLASATVSAVLSLSPALAAKPAKNLPVLNFLQDKQDKGEPQPKEKPAKIFGTVFDVAQAVIPDVTITITDQASKKDWTIKSAPDGTYEFLFPSTGNYSLSFEMRGFKKLVHSDLKVQAGSEIKFDITLEVGVLTGEIIILNYTEVPLSTDKDVQSDLLEKFKLRKKN